MAGVAGQSFGDALRLSYRLLRREWRAGELRVLLAALVVTVASITAVSLFTDRMERAMELGANEVVGERFQLAAVKAVGEGYPLRGRLRVAQAPFAEDTPAKGIPAPGDAWLDARLMSILGIQVGDTLELGARRLRARPGR